MYDDKFHKHLYIILYAVYDFEHSQEILIQIFWLVLSFISYKSKNVCFGLFILTINKVNRRLE